jgi:hypothetical protein
MIGLVNINVPEISLHEDRIRKSKVRIDRKPESGAFSRF